EEVTVLELARLDRALRQRMQPRGEFAHRRRTDRVAGSDHQVAVGAARGEPPAARAVARQLLERVAHDHLAAALDDPVTRRFPHHPWPEARVAEGLEQGLDRLAVVGPLVE